MAIVVLGNFAHTILNTNPRDLHAFIHDLKKYLFTAIIGVNTLYRALEAGDGHAIPVNAGRYSG